MARIRTIKPSFFTDEDVAGFSLAERLTFIGLWTYVDDEGRGKDNPSLIKAALWPLDDKVTPNKVNGYLEGLARSGRICRYEVDGRRFLSVPNFRKHQRISKPQESEIPEPVAERSRNEGGTDAEQLALERKGREEEGERNLPAVVGERDELWNALAAVLDYEPKTRNERSNFGGVVKQLAEVGATADEVHTFARNWQVAFPGARLTVNCFPKWWGLVIKAHPMNGSGVPKAWNAINAWLAKQT